MPPPHPQGDAPMEGDEAAGPHPHLHKGKGGRRPRRPWRRPRPRHRPLREHSLGGCSPSLERRRPRGGVPRGLRDGLGPHARVAPLQQRDEPSVSGKGRRGALLLQLYGLPKLPPSFGIIITIIGIINIIIFQLQQQNVYQIIVIVITIIINLNKNAVIIIGIIIIIVYGLVASASALSQAAAAAESPPPPSEHLSATR